MNRSLGWLNENRYRSYPIEDTETKVMTGFTAGVLPDDFILDFRLVDYYDQFPATHNPTLYRIDAVGSPVTALKLSFNYYIRPLEIEVPVNAVFPYTATLLQPSEGAVPNEYKVLTVVFGEGVQTIAETMSGTRVEGLVKIRKSCVINQARRQVNGVLGSNELGTQYPALAGLVTAVGGYNCELAVTADPPVLRVDAVYGAGAGPACGDGTSEFKCNEVLLRVNGLSAGSEGDFAFVGGNGVEITPDPDNEHTVLIRMTRNHETVKCGA